MAILAISRNLESLPWKERGIFLSEQAKRLGVKKSNLYQQISKLRSVSRKRNKNKGRSQIDAQYVREIVKLKMKIPAKHTRQMATADAITMAEKLGLVPEGLLKVSYTNRLIRENGFMAREGFSVGVLAEKPNELHQFDFSGTEYFQVLKRLEDGDFLLGIRHPNDRPYKNKPWEIRQRLWVAALVDDHSSAVRMNYFVASGESAQAGLDFLRDAWSSQNNADYPYGLPEFLMTDNGAFKRSRVVQNFMDVVGVELVDVMPYKPWVKGKVERFFRTLWQRFELLFLASLPKGSQICLSELQKEVSRYISDFTQKKHPRYKSELRIHRWLKVHQNGGVDTLDEFEKYLFRTLKRVINRYGCIQVEGKEFKIKRVPKELYQQKVTVLMGRKGVIVIDASGNKYKAEPFEPVPFGQYRSFVKSVSDEIQSESDSTEYQNARPYQAEGDVISKVINMPPRETKRKPKSPLDVLDSYTVLEQKHLFLEACAPLLRDLKFRKSFYARLDELVLEGAPKYIVDDRVDSLKALVHEALNNP